MGSGRQAGGKRWVGHDDCDQHITTEGMPCNSCEIERLQRELEQARKDHNHDKGRLEFEREERRLCGKELDELNKKPRAGYWRQKWKEEARDHRVTNRELDQAHITADAYTQLCVSNENLREELTTLREGLRELAENWRHLARKHTSAVDAPSYVTHAEQIEALLAQGDERD